MDELDRAGVSYQIVLTKADKVKPAELAAVETATAEAIRKRPAAHPMIVVTSSQKGDGIETVRAEIAAFSSRRKPLRAAAAFGAADERFDHRHARTPTTRRGFSPRRCPSCSATRTRPSS